MKLDKDKFIIFDKGEYSNYHVVAICKVKEDFDSDEVLMEYIGLYPEQKEEYKFNTHTFINFLEVSKDYIDTIETLTWFLSSDDSFYGIELDGYGIRHLEAGNESVCKDR